MYNNLSIAIGILDDKVLSSVSSLNSIFVVFWSLISVMAPSSVCTLEKTERMEGGEEDQKGEGGETDAGTLEL